MLQPRELWAIGIPRYRERREILPGFLGKQARKLPSSVFYAPYRSTLFTINADIPPPKQKLINKQHKKTLLYDTNIIFRSLPPRPVDVFIVALRTPIFRFCHSVPSLQDSCRVRTNDQSSPTPTTTTTRHLAFRSRRADQPMAQKPPAASLSSLSVGLGQASSPAGPSACSACVA